MRKAQTLDRTESAPGGPAMQGENARLARKDRRPHSAPPAAGPDRAAALAIRGLKPPDPAEVDWVQGTTRTRLSLPNRRT